jgi:hypothetical protein
MIIKAHGEVVTDRKVSDEEKMGLKMKMNDRKVSDEEKMGLKMKMMNVLSFRLSGRRL